MLTFTELYVTHHCCDIALQGRQGVESYHNSLGVSGTWYTTILSKARFLNKVFPALSSSQSGGCNPFSLALVLWVPISPYLLSCISFNLSCENLIVHQKNIPKLMLALLLYSSCMLLLKEQIVSNTRPATLISPFKSTQSCEVNCEFSSLSNLYLEFPVKVKSMHKLLSLQPGTEEILQMREHWVFEGVLCNFQKGFWP